MSPRCQLARSLVYVSFERLPHSSYVIAEELSFQKKKIAEELQGQRMPFVLFTGWVKSWVVANLRQAVILAVRTAILF